ncbi:MAG: zf-HC2 domain-containing protein [Pseudomonadales bacterium]
MGKRSAHKEVREVLPWFVNESLGEKEKQRVLVHLRECPECRAERDELQAIQQVVAEDDGTGETNYRAAFRKLMGRIETAEANRASTHDFEPGGGSSGWRLPLGVAACLLVAVLIGPGSNPLPDSRNLTPGEPGNVAGTGIGRDGTDAVGFRTLSEPSAVVTGVPHRIALTFAQPVMAKTLRSALIETKSNIVSGPDADGRYIVEVTVPAHMTDLEFINSMRAIDGVQYAAFYDTPQ